MNRTNNKGVSIISLIIIIIVIIILASIGLSKGGDSIEKANKALFLTEFDGIETSLNAYIIKGQGKNKNFIPKNLSWDGASERATNTAKLEDGVNEDKISYIINSSFNPNDSTIDVNEKVTIKNGKLYVKEEYETERKWILESSKYSYMSGD